MWHDSIVEEVRHVRATYANRFDNNIHAICEDIRKRQSASSHTVVSLQAQTPTAEIAKNRELDAKYR
ncbi:MAG: hypothetical protein Q8O31_06010 [Rhodocyclaceae bacterium]|nr:hypothetical protein [Rhodocyclaceae bacterium]